MSQTRAALRYAKAVLDLAQEQNVSAQVNQDMKTIAQAVAASKDLKDMLMSAAVPTATKKSALLAVFTGLHASSVQLIDVLIKNKRIDILGEVAQKFTDLFDQSQGKQVATVTTAVALTPEVEAKVLDKVKELTGRDADLVSVVDPAVLGGFILRVGDIQYDASIANKLNKLKREFTLN